MGRKMRVMAGLLVGPIMEWFRKAGCKHEYVNQIEHNGKVSRLFLRCLHCDHETDGWACEVKELRRSV